VTARARRLAVGFVALSVLYAPSALAAQSTRPLKQPPGFTVDQWTTVNGLPQNSVNAIAQTPMATSG
jgi:hypothetical protein